MSNANSLPARAEFPPILSKVSTWRTIWAISTDWAIIAGAIMAAVKLPHPVTFLFAQLVIGARQHAFFAILHEGTHYNISKNRAWNDRISNFLAAWPVGFSTERYRVRHWIHHRYLNTEKDPDWTRKRDDVTWQFPMSPKKFWETSLAHLCGKGLIEMSYALRGIGVQKSDLPVALPYYGTIALILTLTGTWKFFALYWVLPFFTVLPFLHRVRNAVEHLGLPKSNPLNGTRNIMSSGFEKFFFGPHNTNYHLIHHIYPFIPAYRLPAARTFLRTNAYFRENAWENDAYLLPTRRAVYRDMTTSTSNQDPTLNKQAA